MPRAGGADVPGPSDVPRLLLDAAPPAGARTLSRLRHARAHGMGTTEYLRHALRRAVLRARLRRRLELAPEAYVGAGVVLDVAPGARLSLGRGCWLGDGSLMRIRGGEVTIGDRSLLGEGCAISAHRRVTIGAGCLIGDRVMIVDFDHETADVERPVRLQGLRAAAVELGDGARIGPNAAVLRGVTVGAGAAVDARSVVTRDVPAGATVTGVPARRRVAQTGTRSRSA